jgi:amino-acid N-acetyltransferase
MPKRKTLSNRLNKLQVQFTHASRNDLKEIKSLLIACNLLSEDIEFHLNNFIVAKLGGKLVGVIGLEGYGKVCLLRSFAVDPDYRRKGIANELFHQILSLAQERNVKEAYLLTTTIDKICTKLGFRTIGRAKIPEVIQNTKEFSRLCPKTATCMYWVIL